MDSGYDVKLEAVEALYRKDLQRLESLTKKDEINGFIDDLKKRVETLEEDVAIREQTISEQQTFLSAQVAKDDKEIVQKKLDYTRELLELADKKMNPEFYAAKERVSKERTSSFATLSEDQRKRSSSRDSMLGRTRTSSIGEAPFKTARSGSLGVPVQQPSPPTTPFKSTTGIPREVSSTSGNTSIDKDINEIERLFKQAAGQGYKKENAEEISKYLTNYAASLFMQIRESDVVNPKRHKAKDSTDLRYSQFSNRLFEIVNEPFKRLEEELKKIDAGSKSPEEKQKILQEKEKLIKMLLKIADDLRENRNFIALMSIAAVLDAQINKKANVEIKEKLSDGELDKIKSNMKLYEPGSSDLTLLQEKYLREKKSVIPQIGSMKNKFVYIDEYKDDDKKRASAIRQEDEQIALFRLYQQTLARDIKANLSDVKLKYSELELHEVEQQAVELRQEISQAPNVEVRHKLYEKLMENLSKRTTLLQEQSALMEKIINDNNIGSKRSKELSLVDANKIRDQKVKRKSLLEETSDTKNAMLFNEAKLIAAMNAEQITEKYSKSLPKLLNNLDAMLSKLSDDKMPLPKRTELLKETDLIMHELDIKAKAITHRLKDVSLSRDNAKQMFKDIEQIFAKKEELILVKNSIEKSLGKSDSISLHSTSKPK